MPRRMPDGRARPLMQPPPPVLAWQPRQAWIRGRPGGLGDLGQAAGRRDSGRELPGCVLWPATSTRPWRANTRDRGPL